MIIPSGTVSVIIAGTLLFHNVWQAKMFQDWFWARFYGLSSGMGFTGDDYPHQGES
jgi:hypothetical protein